MNKKGIRRAILCLTAMIVVGALTACNVFEPFISKSATSSSYESLLINGNNAMSAGDDASALLYFAQAMEVNPAGSEAYLFHAQAIIGLYHIDYAGLQSALNSKNSGTGLPFIDSNSTVQSLDSTYHPVYVAVSDLEHILRQPQDTIYLDSAHDQFLPPDGDTASDGKISADVARLDLGILEAVKGILAPIDLDSNGHLNTLCGASLSAASKSQHCPKGDSSEVFRLNNYRALTQSVQFDSIENSNFNVTSITNFINDPHNINAFINSLRGPVEGADYNLTAVNNSVKMRPADSLSATLGKITGQINDLSNFLGYITYNDGIDDDYDHQRVEDLNPPQKPTRMLWHDFDNDRGIRYDYDDSARFAPYLASSMGNGNNFGNPGNIGHPVHRYLHPELYVRYSDWMKTYPELASDSSPNSRVHLMQKKCHDMVSSMQTAGLNAQTANAINTTVCDSITTILKNTVTPPVHSDWIGGTAGVDEEMLDGVDNDYDGLTDEDTRNLPGYDDDADAVLKPCMVYKNCPDGALPTPEQWHDTPIPGNNKCADIDSTVAPPANNPRQNCIGTLENRLYMAHRGFQLNPNSPFHAADSLRVYYAPAGSEPDPICIENYEDSSAAFRSLWTDADANLACEFRHIWIAPRPPRSEWTGGTLGIDEEILDGVDNDGDGWVDEDLRQ